MARSVFLLLIENKGRAASNDFQVHQEETARAEATRLGIDVEVAFASASDQLVVLRRRLREAGSRRLDAVIAEPASTGLMDMIVRDTKGRTGLVLLNDFGPSVEEASRTWGTEHPLGTVSADHIRIGEIQGEQIAALLPQGGVVLSVLGPQRSNSGRQRLRGMKSKLGPDIKLYETEGGNWSEAAGAEAFNNWYAVFRVRSEAVHVVAAQNDELAVGARRAAEGVAHLVHRQMFQQVSYLGVDACPRYGKLLVDSGRLAASVVMPSSTEPALRNLDAFWSAGCAMPLRAFTHVTAYPPDLRDPGRLRAPAGAFAPAFS